MSSESPVRRKVKTMLMFAHGGIAAFDEAGQQIPELQETTIRLWINHATFLGFDIDGCKFSTPQEPVYGTIIETPDGHKIRIGN